MSLSQFLTNIANSIRSKKGTTESISAANFATEIENLETGGASEYFDTSPAKGISARYLMSKKIKKVPLIDITNVDDVAYMFYQFGIEEVPLIDMKNIKNAISMFENCTSLRVIPQLNTNNLKHADNIFSGCTLLETISLLDFSSIISIQSILTKCENLTNLGGFKDIGKSYSLAINNYYAYTLNLSYLKKITHESLMNIIINLYDLNLTYDVANGGTLYVQQLILGTNKEKLIAAEIAMITRKGWIAS